MFRGLIALGVLILTPFAVLTTTIGIQSQISMIVFLNSPFYVMAIHSTVKSFKNKSRIDDLEEDICE